MLCRLRDLELPACLLWAQLPVSKWGLSVLLPGWLPASQKKVSSAAVTSEPLFQPLGPQVLPLSHIPTPGPGTGSVFQIPLALFISLLECPGQEGLAPAPWVRPAPACQGSTYRLVPTSNTPWHVLGAQ